MTANVPSTGATIPPLEQTLSPSALHTLESLKLKADSLKQSTQSLIDTLCTAAPPPPWPEILSKYTVLLSQTHTLSTSLVDNNVDLTNLALHQSIPLTETQFESEFIVLLRTLQTNEVLTKESATVRRLAERMRTKGSLGPVSVPTQNGAGGGLGASTSISHEEVLQECTEIKEEHDRRVDRAVRAVAMLREKFDWKSRVVVETEEPEEVDWVAEMRIGVDEGAKVAEGSEVGSSVGDEEELEVVLGTGADATPEPDQPDTPMATG